MSPRRLCPCWIAAIIGGLLVLAALTAALYLAGRWA